LESIEKVFYQQQEQQCESSLCVFLNGNADAHVFVLVRRRIDNAQSCIYHYYYYYNEYNTISQGRC